MSQQAARKVGKAAGCSDGGRCRSRSRTAGTAPKAAAAAAAGEPARQKHRSKSRNKIPKSVRYDLENALVGLCNVWFEDIKPHLLRNNIKVHVHPPSAAGAAGAEGDLPAGAQATPAPAPAPPRCRHVNPGAAPDCPPHHSVNFADFCSTRPTASSAPSPRRRVSRRPALPPLPSPPPSASPPSPSQGPFHNCESDVCNQLRRARKTRFTKTSTHDKSNSKSAVSNEMDFHLNLSNLKRVRNKTKTKEVGSQTECPAPYPVCARRHRSCARVEPLPKSKRLTDSHRKAVIKRNKSTQTDLYLYVPLKTRSSGTALKRRVRSPRPASHHHSRPPRRVRSLSRVRPSSRAQPSSHALRSPPSRASATQRKISPSRLNSFETTVHGDVFRDEFIEDIAEKRDPNILLLYRSPRMEGTSSVVDTAPVLSVNIQRKRFNKKLTTWK